MFKCIFTGFLLFCFSQCAYAQSFDINLSEESAQIMFRGTIGKEVFDYTEFNAMFLYTPDSWAGSVGLDACGELDAVSDLELGVGFKVYGADADDNEAVSIGLGGVARYTPTVLEGIVFSGLLYYSPRVVSFMEADRLFHGNIRIGYQIISRALVYIGYRNMWIDTEDEGKVTVDEGIHVGIEFTF